MRTRRSVGSDDKLERVFHVVDFRARARPEMYTHTQHTYAHKHAHKHERGEKATVCVCACAPRAWLERIYITS